MTKDAIELILPDALRFFVSPEAAHARSEAYRRMHDFRAELDIDLALPTEQQLVHHEAVRSNAVLREQKLLSECTRADRVVVNDLRRQLLLGQLFLYGIPDDGNANASYYLIPGHRASRLEFDPWRATAVDGEIRYLAVMVSRTFRPDAPSAPQLPSDAAATSTLSEARDLTDAQILSLLEEYARRVVEEERSSLKLPAKVSFIPILRRKMRHRFVLGQNASTLRAEAYALERWIRSKVDGHQTPGAGHIENELREEYRHLKSQHPSPASKDGQS